MTLLEIVEQYLIANKFDGLFSDDGCACEVGDLFPCEAPHGDCQPGYKSPCDCGEGHSYHISLEKP